MGGWRRGRRAASARWWWRSISPTPRRRFSARWLHATYVKARRNAVASEPKVPPREGVLEVPSNELGVFIAEEAHHLQAGCILSHYCLCLA